MAMWPLPHWQNMHFTAGHCIELSKAEDLNSNPCTATRCMFERVGTFSTMRTSWTGNGVTSQSYTLHCWTEVSLLDITFGHPHINIHTLFLPFILILILYFNIILTLFIATVISCHPILFKHYTCPDTLAPSYEHLTTREAGGVAAEMERRKNVKYRCLGHTAAVLP